MRDALLEIGFDENERSFAAIFARGKGGESSAELTRCLVEALRESGEGRGVKFSRLWNRVSREIRKRNGEQVPVCVFEGADFYIGNEPGKRAAADEKSGDRL